MIVRGSTGVPPPDRRAGHQRSVPHTPPHSHSRSECRLRVDAETTPPSSPGLLGGALRADLNAVTDVHPLGLPFALAAIFLALAPRLSHDERSFWPWSAGRRARSIKAAICSTPSTLAATVINRRAARLRSAHRFLATTALCSGIRPTATNAAARQSWSGVIHLRCRAVWLSADSSERAYGLICGVHFSQRYTR